MTVRQSHYFIEWIFLLLSTLLLLLKLLVMILYQRHDNRDCEMVVVIDVVHPRHGRHVRQRPIYNDRLDESRGSNVTSLRGAERVEMLCP